MEAAVALGLDAFTMQGIAERLGVTAPALYTHVAGREEVLALVNAHLRHTLESFTSPAPTWQGWLVDFATLLRELLGPSAASLMVDLRSPGATPQITMGEQGLQLLLADGFSPEQAAYAMWLVFRLAVTAGPADQTSFAGFMGDTGTVLGQGSDDALPATSLVHRTLAATGPHDTFAFDLAVAVAGLDAQPRTPARAASRLKARATSRRRSETP